MLVQSALDTFRWSDLCLFIQFLLCEYPQQFYNGGSLRHIPGNVDNSQPVPRVIETL